MKAFFASIAVAMLLASCSLGSGDTYLRFSVDGRDYEMGDIDLMIVSSPKSDRRLLLIGQDPLKTNSVTNIPGGDIQWKMRMDDVSDLENRELTFNGNSKHELILQFMLTEDVGVIFGPESSLKIRFGHVGNGVIDGSLSADRLDYVSMVDDVVRSTSLEAEFRAVLKHD